MAPEYTTYNSQSIRALVHDFTMIVVILPALIQYSGYESGRFALYV